MIESVIESVIESAKIRSKVNSLGVTQPDYQTLYKTIFLSFKYMNQLEYNNVNAATLLHCINDNINTSLLNKSADDFEAICFGLISFSSHTYFKI